MPTSESIEFVYGAPEHGEFRLYHRDIGEQLARVLSYPTWGALAQASGDSWKDFYARHSEDLIDWAMECNDGKPVRAATPLPPEELHDLFETYVAPLPDALAMRMIEHAIKGKPGAAEALGSIATFGGGAPGAAFDAVILGRSCQAV